MSTPTGNELGIRIIELPHCRMASSKGHGLDEFDRWWTSVDRQRIDKFYPRDFMYYDRAHQALIWLYALPAGADAGPYTVIDFPGGLYAAAISKDQDDTDGERVMNGIKQWTIAAGLFRDAESEARPVLFHVTTPDAAFERMKYRQLDIYVPIE